MFAILRSCADVYDTELEKMNTSFLQQNAELHHDNKQLAILLKEYEQTLETVMDKFRTQAVRLLSLAL